MLRYKTPMCRPCWSMTLCCVPCSVPVGLLYDLELCPVLRSCWSMTLCRVPCSVPVGLLHDLELCPVLRPSSSSVPCCVVPQRLKEPDPDAPETREAFLFYDVLTMLEEAVLPCLVLLEANCCLAEEIWTVLAYYPYQHRSVEHTHTGTAGTPVRRHVWR